MPCTQWPVQGADKCKMHVGRKVEDVKRERVARQAVVTYGLPSEVDPHDALLEEVHRTAGHVRWLGDIVAGLESEQLVWGRTREGTDRGERTFVEEAAPSVWLKLYHDERAHLVRVAKAAIDAGIDERRVQLAEQQGELIVQVIRATLTDLGVEVTPEVGATVGRHLRAVG